ncbi:MAG: murein biosynthesis integral membrane protein MurJ [Microbacteriaceae bacterium]
MSNQEIRRASLLLASGTVVSRALGFIRAIVLAAAIGLVGSASANAFAIANQLPNTIYAIVAGGVLSAVLVPQIVRASAAADGGAAYINKLLTIAIVVLGLTTVIATIAAPLLTFLYGTQLDQPTLALAIAFAFWCLPQIFFYGMYTVFGEVLNARKSFGPYTWAPVINNIIALLGLVALMVIFGADPAGSRSPAEWTPGMIALLAGSATLGVIGQALVLLLFWKRVGLKFALDWKWRGFGLSAAGKMAGWSFGMLLLTTFAGLVETNVAGIASNANEASVAALTNAWLIFMLPHSIITVSIATAYFTRMSEHAARGDLAAVRTDLSSAARGIGLIMVLASLVIIVCSPFIGAVFMPGDITGIAAFGVIVIAYVIGLVPFSMLFIVQRTFYTLGDTRTPFFYTLAQVVFICLGAVWVAQFAPMLISFALALLVSIAGTIQLVIATVILRRRIGGIDGYRITRSFVRYSVAAIPTVLVGIAAFAAINSLDPYVHLGVQSRFGAIATMAILGSLMSVTYLGTLLALRTPELRETFARLLSRARRSSE